MNFQYHKKGLAISQHIYIQFLNCEEETINFATVAMPWQIPFVKWKVYVLMRPSSLCFPISSNIQIRRIHFGVSPSTSWPPNWYARLPLANFNKLFPIFESMISKSAFECQETPGFVSLHQSIIYSSVPKGVQVRITPPLQSCATALTSSNPLAPH